MPDISLAENDWESSNENIARVKLRNVYIAEDPTTPDGTTRVGRPTLTTYKTLGTGPINGMFELNGALGIFDGALVLSGSTLYLLDLVANTTASIGTVPGTTLCQFAATKDRVIIVRDGIAYTITHDGVTLVITEVSMPDSISVGSVASINGYFILSVLEDNVFYWINPGEDNPDPLSFASAERYPDPIISVNVTSDEIWFLGSKGPEVWQATGDADAPFARIPARDYNEGCLTSTTVASVTYKGSPALIWVSPTGAVILAQGATARISNESEEELLKGVAASALRAYSFRYNRHDFYVLTCPFWTLVYDITRRNWLRWDCNGLAYLKGGLGFQHGSTAYAGDTGSGKVFIFTEDKTDDGANVVHEISGGVVNTGKPYACSSVSIRASAGWQGGDPTPVLYMRFSDDQGQTWSSYQTSSGLAGKHLDDVVFRSLGLITRPGRLFEFMFQDAYRVRFDYANINEA